MLKKLLTMTIIGGIAAILPDARGSEIEKINVSRSIDVGGYNNPQNLLDQKPETQYCVPKVKDFTATLVYKTPVKARYLTLAQGGWPTSRLWSLPQLLQITINCETELRYELKCSPTNPQALDLKEERQIKTLAIKVLSVYEGEQACGGFSGIDLQNTAPKAEIILPKRPIVAHFLCTPEHTSGLKTVAMDIEVAPAKANEYFVDVLLMDNSVWRAKPKADGPYTLKPEDFTRIEKGYGVIPMRWAATYQIEITAVPLKQPKVDKLKIGWQQDNNLAFPWEKDKAPVAIDGKTFYPGVFTNNCGHFGFRYEPNGLLIGNISFDRLEQDHVGNGGNLALFFKIPGGKYSEKQVVFRRDDEKHTGAMVNRAGIDNQKEYIVAADSYNNDSIKVDWTSVRWWKQIPAANGKSYFQELRYSTLAPGAQVETDSPAFEFTFKNALMKKGPAAVVMPVGNQLQVMTKPEELTAENIAKMSQNWLLMLNGLPEYPVLLVFQQRPDSLQWTADGLTVKRARGVGTLAFGFLPNGAVPQPITTAAQWAANPRLIPLKQIKDGVNLLAAYPWSCKEYFAVDGDKVTIRDEIGFLPWQDEWNFKPKKFSPLPPMIAVAMDKNMLPSGTVTGLIDFKIPTKWGWFRAVPGDVITYRLPIPRLWDYMPLKVAKTADNAWLYDRLERSLTTSAIEQKFGTARNPDTLIPSEHPHGATFDFSFGAQHAMNFMTPDNRKLLNDLGGKFMRSGLLPQNYRLRIDPLSGTQYLACTSWTVPDYEVNGDNLPDIDYWQGVTIYGLYDFAKYSGKWDVMKRHWPLIRSLLTYWEAEHSWVMMSPGARESGDMYHSDMPTAGYTGLIGFHNLAKELGTDYQKALGAYLLAKATVPMKVKFDFNDWMKQIQHAYGRDGYLGNGFGECFIASFNTCRAEATGFSEADPWWRTGCIGPLSGQNEVMDLYSEIKKPLIKWERQFEKMCPNDGFAKIHDETRVMPHVMMRMYLAPEMMPSATDLLRKFHDGYILRDVHIPAGMLAWSCPVRPLEWATALPLGGEWNEKEKTAKLAFSAPAKGAIIKVALRNPAMKVSEHGCAIPSRLGKTEFDGWTAIEFECPAGTHEFTIK